LNNLITWQDMRLDEVESGLPRLTLDASATGGPGPVTFALAPEAVRALVDGLAGVAPPPPGEVRIVARFDVRALAEALRAPTTHDSALRCLCAPCVEWRKKYGIPAPTHTDPTSTE